MARLLIVEDDLSILEMLCAILRHDYDILSASNPEDAVRACKGHNPDVLLVDYILPRCTGLELIAQLRSYGHDGYAILMSCSPQKLHEPHDWERLKIFDTAAKPLDMHLLLRQIHNAVELAESETTMVGYLREFYGRSVERISELAAI